jgi:hypothetical protein
MYRDSTTASGTSDTPSVSIPSVKAYDWVFLACSIDASGAVFDPTDYPAGFVELGEVDLTLDGQSFAVGWKIAHAAESGTYQFGGLGTGGTANWVCQAFSFSARRRNFRPVMSAIATNNSANGSPVSVTANGVYALPGSDLLMLSAPDVNATGIGNGHTVPTGFFLGEEAENGFSNLAGFVRENVREGNTGSVTATFALTSGASGWAAALITMAPEDVPIKPPRRRRRRSRDGLGLRGSLDIKRWFREHAHAARLPLCH